MASFKKLTTGWQFGISYKDGENYRTKSGNGYPTKKDAQIAAADIEQKLQSLQAELDAREARSEEASQALKTADQAISQANRKLRDLREEKRGVEDELAKLRKSGNNVANNLKDAENTVAQIAKAQYINSRRSHWQNLIGGINPSTLASDKGKP